MDTGFVVLFWFVVLAVLGALCLALVALAFVSWRKKRVWLKWGAGIPAAGLLMVGVIGAGLMVYGIVNSSNPRSVFKMTFGKDPPPTATEIHSKVYWFADTGSVYLRFKVEEAEFDQLVPEGLSRQPMEQTRQDLPSEGGFSPPAWWGFSFHPEWKYFLRNDFGRDKPGKKGFYSETEYFAYDTASKTAYYRFLGID